MTEPGPIDRCGRALALSMTYKQYERLPRHADYRYDFLDGTLHISPRLRTAAAFLALRDPGGRPPDEDDDVLRFRPLADGDWDLLPATFAAAFAAVAPFAHLGRARRLRAARDCLAYTRAGGHGPPIGPACVVAEVRGRDLLGAVLVTRLGELERLIYLDRRAGVAPPPDPSSEALGQPHLTWAFVDPMYTGYGLGTALLAAATRALWGLGHRELAVSFNRGNAGGAQWHSTPSTLMQVDL